ncbi:BatA domain-containing protein [Bythopirellula polymerisocia]|uniref:Aerotolerance regulator N-terminal domain-containing protein n=1 Tax=Bythopirellula polymerisocia TaxID=2528003 RepID=A0A5C6CNQ1_9BACT|nr:BatA domain-containing protein [Bythopirellula polymerisocia]TWU26008.1 hypothetical protein Pla144_32250 [Bythopirellula polymerisocia]
MSFLEPWMLAALPLAALPILIHLINQRRFQTLDWGAMRFLLEANRMSRGYARIRQWLILALRTLAIVGLVLAVSRPLASGRLGLAAGGRADTTIILVDRSPSMQQRGKQVASSKLQRGVDQIASALESVGSSRWVLIDSVSLTPQELEAPKRLRTAPQTGSASAAADLPALLRAAHDYMQANHAGQTEIWICSDLRANDWDAEGGEWSILRDSFQEFPQGVRFHLLAYPEAAPANLALRVTKVERQKTRQGSEVLLSLTITRSGDDNTIRVPVQFEIDGARSELSVELSGLESTVENHPLPLTSERVQGWGIVSLPADANPADNQFYFVYSDPPIRRTAIVAENPALVRPLQLAASIAAAPGVESEAVVLGPDQIATLPWEENSLVLWQAPLPSGRIAAALQSFVEHGGSVVFFPPANPTDANLFDVEWQAWTEPAEPLAVANWRGDQDLLSRTLDGAALPVGELAIYRYCTPKGETTPLATFPDGAPLWARRDIGSGAAYFCATTVLPGDSTLASDGIVLYAAVQRAIAGGAERLVATQQRVAGVGSMDTSKWQKLAGDSEALSTEAAFQAGVYSLDERLVAVNRSTSEDAAAVLADERVDGLFEGLEYDRVADRVDSLAGLTREIWRLFLIGMIVALVGEAALCLPKRRPATANLASSDLAKGRAVA